MNCRAPAGKFKFRCYLNTSPPCFLDTASVDESAARKEVMAFLLEQKHVGVEILKIQTLTGAKHYPIQSVNKT